MGQPIVDKYRARQRKDLSLVLQPPERGGENHPVIVALKIRAYLTAVEREFLQTESCLGY